MKISTRARTPETLRPFRPGDLITPKRCDATGKTVILLTRRGEQADCFEYISFTSSLAIAVSNSTPHKFTNDEWELLEGELVLSN